MTWTGGATLAIDAGTTLIKGVVFDDDGLEIAVARRGTALSSPHPGWSEQDMDEVVDAVLACAEEAARRTDAPIERIALTAQGDGAWMIRADGSAARPAVLWNDGRSADIVDRWARDGLVDAAFRLTGSLGNLGLPHAILAWFLANDPAALDGVQDVSTCGSWLFRSLTGVRGLHPSDASVPWADARTGEYSAAVLSLFGLEHVRPLLPPILGAEELTAPLTARIAARIGIPAGTPVTLAPYDVVATAVGGGVVSAGSAFAILGTTLCTGALVDAVDTTGVPTGLALRGGTGLPIVRAFPTLAGTGVVDWIRDVLGLEDAAAVSALAARSAPGAGGVRILPYLSPAGERMPFLDPEARGAIAGLSFRNGPADIARAALEALALVIRDCVTASGSAATEIVLSGGGAASDVWCQMIADVVGVGAVRIEGSQIGAKGAFLHAACASGRCADLAEAAEAFVRRSAVFPPSAETRGLYAESYRALVATREALRAMRGTAAPVASPAGR